jgi:hypothetical protein
MPRFLFFLLLVASVALGSHLWLTLEAERAPKPRGEINPESLKVLQATDPKEAARQVAATRALQQRLAESACVDLAGAGVAQSDRLRELLQALDLGPRQSERRIEEVTRHAVTVSGFADKRAVDAAVSSLRTKGITDYQVLADNSVSLGVFGTEEGAQRHLAELLRKGVRGAQVTPRTRELRDIVFTVLKPDLDLAGKLLIVAREIPGLQLVPTVCPGTVRAAAPVPTP